MIYKQFQDVRLSALGFGCMRLPTVDGNDSNVDETEAARLIARATWSQEECPQFMGAIGKAIDVHDSRMKLTMLERMASHDPLTGLLNHSTAQEQIKALTALLNLTDEQSFDRLRLDVYSDRPWGDRTAPPGRRWGRWSRCARASPGSFPTIP